MSTSNSTPTTPPGETPVPSVKTHTHPGFTWLDSAACGDLDDKSGGKALALFFVDAGHVIDESTLNVCRGCPVRTECILHAYLGGPDNGPIVGGYMGGLSLGQRRHMTLDEALDKAKHDPPRTGRHKSS